MAITLELLPDLEARLTAQAHAQGLQLEDFIRQLLERAAVKRFEKMISAEELEARLDALARGSENLPYLPPEDITREGLYRDHD